MHSLEHALKTASMIEPEPVLPNDADTAVAAGAAHQARRLSDLLTRASEVLAQGTDIGSQLREVARAIVPAYAAACVIERFDTAAALREVLCTQHESVALDVDLRAWACQPDWFSHVITEVAETGKLRQLDLHEEADVLAIGGTRDDVASARALGFESVLVVPLVARRRVFGIVTCAVRASRRYGQRHVEAFADLAHRVALALDNAELLSTAQQTRHDHDELLAALSDDVYAPLAALSEAAAQSLGNSLAAQQFVRETQRLQAQLRELIDVNQLRAGHLQLRMQDFELAPLLQRTLERVRKSDVEARLTSQFDIAVAGLHVHADPERLAQAFHAILSTALANTPDDRKLEIILSRVEGDLQVTVIGTDTRLSTQELAGLSDLTGHHYEGVTSPARPGQGLRLARALVEMQGGRLWAESQSTAGYALHISLPLCAAHARDVTELPSPETVILLVDCDLAFRRELQEILSERGYKVETADNGLQAWQYLLGHSAPALILFDLMLPAMDGWELHAAIKSHAALQLVPTVVVSGLDRYRIEASLPDAHGYIEKPIRSAQLFEVVQRHVANPARPRTLSVRPSSCL